VAKILATTGTIDMLLDPVMGEIGPTGPTGNAPKHSGTGIGTSAGSTPQTPTGGVTTTKMCRNTICLDILLTGEGNLAIENLKGATGPDLERILVIALDIYRVVRCRDYERQVRTPKFTSSLRMRNQRWNHQEWSLMQRDASN
jgi:hypothetical protein